MASRGVAPVIGVDSHKGAERLVAAGMLIGAGALFAFISASDVSASLKAIFHAFDVGFGAAAGPVDEFLMERGTSTVKRTQELLRGTVSAHPVRLSAFVALTLVFVERLVIILFGCFYALYIVTLEGQHALNLNDVVTTTVLLSYPVAVPILILTALLLARYAGHRLASYPLPWIAGSLVVAIAIDVGLTYLFAHLAHLAVPAETVAKLFSVLFSLELAAAVVGSHWAKGERRAYLMGRVYRSLTADDQLRLMETAQAEINGQYG